MKPGARVAIVHDWFQGHHGSERVVDAMRADVFGDDVHTDVFTFHAARELLPDPLARSIVRESRLARLPGIRQRGHDPGHWRYLLPYMPLFFRSLDLSGYDLVVSSSHSCAVHASPPAGTPHLCYCYTPMRYAWLREVDRDRGAGIAGRGLGMAAAAVRRIDLAASRRPHRYVAISESVRDRIRRFYGRDAAVVYPPVDIHEIRPDQDKDPDLFLWVHRLVPYKRPEVVVEAFRGLSQRLVMVGIGPLEKRLRSALPRNVELRGWLPRAELCRLYERATGFVHVGEEDFGISMVEALAGGAAVVALDRGGAGEIVRDGIDGHLLAAPTATEIRAAVRSAAAHPWDRAALAERASEFSPSRFVKRLREEIQLSSPGGAGWPGPPALRSQEPPGR